MINDAMSTRPSVYRLHVYVMRKRFSIYCWIDVRFWGIRLQVIHRDINISCVCFNAEATAHDGQIIKVRYSACLYLFLECL